MGCFSPCGRLIASPFGFGVRLLGFNSQCQDLSSCVPEEPVRLYEVGTKMGHQEVVLSSAFSPTHWLLATGCLSGSLVWHQPVIRRLKIAIMGVAMLRDYLHCLKPIVFVYSFI